MSKKLAIHISHTPKSKSVSILKSPLNSLKSVSSSPNPSGLKTLSSLFQELQTTKCENLKEINARKQKETILFHKLMNSLKDPETKQFIQLEEKYKEKKKEFLKNCEEKCEKLKERIEKAEQERKLLQTRIEVREINKLIKSLAEEENVNQCEELTSELASYKLTSTGLNKVHSDVSAVIAARSHPNYKSMINSLANSILDTQSKSNKILAESEKLIKYREDLQKSLKS